MLSIMDFGDIENEYFCPSTPRIVREDRFSQDVAQHRPRKCPRKRLKPARSSASLVIEQLKSGFRGDLALPRMRARRNWRLECLTKHFRNNRCGRDEERGTVAVQCRPRSLAPEAPRIYSIGLYSSASTLHDRAKIGGDPSSPSGAIRNVFKKRLNIVRRAMIVCKYWTAQSILPSLLASASLRDYVDRQAMVIERAKSADVAKFDPELQAPQSDPCSEKNDGGDGRGGTGGDSSGGGGPLCDDCTLNLTFESLSNDRSFPKSDPNDFSAERDHRPDRFRVARKDVQIQTSSKSWRRRRTKGRSKATSEETRRCKHETNSDESTARSSNASEMFTDFCADLHHSDRRHYVEKPKLSVRALENKRAEYINKFKSVSRQIEEITATLRETCCGDKNLQNSPDDCDKYFSFSAAADSARTKRKLDEGEAGAVLPNESTPKERDPILAVERRTVVAAEPKRERRKSAREASRIGYGAINDETAIVVPRNAAALPMNRHKGSDILVHDFARALTTDETARPAGKTPRQGKKRAECRAVKQIAFDLDLTKKRDEGREGASMEAFSEIYLRDDLGASSSNEYAKVKTIEDLDLDLEGLRSKKIAEEKMGERAVLVDIKRRIDRDFDDRSTDRCENEEDFLTVSPSQGSGSFENERRSFDDAKKLVTPGGTIDEERSISTPLLYRQPSDTADVRIRDSTSVVSEYSNRNSLSKYFSCTQFSSLTSLTENENELAFAFEDQDTITRDPSYTNVHSDSNYYDLELSSSIDCLYPDSSPNEYSYSNGDFERRADYTVDYTRQDPRSVRSVTPEKFYHERDRLNEMSNVFETSGDLADKIAYDHEYLPGDRDEAKVSRAELEKRCIGDSTFDSTSKSSRYIGSIDSGVFVNSSLIDFYPHESLAEAGGKPGVKKRTRRARRLNASSVDSSSDGSSCTDDTLGRKVDDVVRDLTKNLILCERRAKMRLEEMQKSFRARRVSHSQHSRPRASKLSKDTHDAYYDFFNLARCSDDERIISISTPSLVSLSDSEIDERELRCQL